MPLTHRTAARAALLLALCVGIAASAAAQAAPPGETGARKPGPPSSHRFQLSPELTVRTVALGSDGAAAGVTLFAGGRVLYRLAMTQASPVAVVPVDLVLGDAWVAAGTSFTLTVATPLQPGQVFMQGRFRSRATPETTIAAAIATWTMDGPSVICPRRRPP